MIRPAREAVIGLILACAYAPFSTSFSVAQGPTWGDRGDWNEWDNWTSWDNDWWQSDEWVRDDYGLYDPDYRWDVNEREQDRWRDWYGRAHEDWSQFNEATHSEWPNK